VHTLQRTDPDRACWTIWDAEPVVSFWRRRMTNEAAKHLWDLRTALETDPPLPDEISLEERGGVVDEFVELLVPAARARGIAPLPRSLLLASEDLERTWLFSPGWEVTTSPLSDLTSGIDADVVRANAGDLILFIWGRARPWDLPDRFHISDDATAIEAFSLTPVHL
jgi:hypothetical protein